MAGFRFSCFWRKVSPFSLEKQVCLYSAKSPRCSSSFAVQSDCDESLVYRRKLLFQRPTTIKWEERLCNSVSFIGRVIFPLKTVRSREFGVHTMLQVKSSRNSEPSLRILLKMWDSMAEISSKHLKEQDFIYVSGHLGLYTKVDASGKPRTFYEVNVKELNYVAYNHKAQTTQETEDYEPKEGTNPLSSASNVEKNMETLNLWQVFFANPYEWWDNRRHKTNPRYPDFKHKDTGECLWLSPDDPPWVGKQLQLHDSRMAEMGLPELANPQSDNSIWKYVD